MKRILYLGIVLTTLLMASNAFCGTDDSGLQVFTLNGADMMGETADVGQEDTKISQYSLNMFQSGNSLTVPVRSNSDYSYTCFNYKNIHWWFRCQRISSFFTGFFSGVRRDNAFNINSIHALGFRNFCV